MRLTRFTDNALRCLIFLGTSREQVHTVGDVALRMNISEDHLLKVVQRLVELGYVRTIRGRRGGLRLAREPETLTVAEIVQATEDNLAIVPCFDPPTNDCPIASACTLAGALDAALKAFFATLERFTLADLVRQRVRLRELMVAE